MGKMRDECLAKFSAMHKEFPQVNITLVNGPITTLEAFPPLHFPGRAVLFGRQRGRLVQSAP